MTTSNTVKSLAKKHAEIQGNIQKVETTLQQLKNSLYAIETSIHLFDPNYNTRKINAKRTNKKSTALGRGEIPQFTGDFVRHSKEPFKASEILDFIMEEKGIVYSTAECQRIKANINKALERLEKESIVQKQGVSGKGGALLWGLVH